MYSACQGGKVGKECSEQGRLGRTPRYTWFYAQWPKLPNGTHSGSLGGFCQWKASKPSFNPKCPKSTSFGPRIWTDRDVDRLDGLCLAAAQRGRRDGVVIGWVRGEMVLKTKQYARQARVSSCLPIPLWVLNKQAGEP